MPYATRSKAGGRGVVPSIPAALMKSSVNEPEDDMSEYASEDCEDKSESEGTSKKQQRKARSNAKGKAKASDSPARGTKGTRVSGRLSILPSMPMDILFEIFGHLPPEDLVRLSRTSKAFRQVLLSKQSTFLWKSAFENSDNAPPCPEDIDELAWAKLLFGGSYCQSCGARSVKKVLFMLRMRLCQACIQSELMTMHRAFTECVVELDACGVIPDGTYGELMGTLRDAVPADKARFKPGRYAYTDWHTNPRDVEALCNEIKAVSRASTSDNKADAVENIFRERRDRFGPMREHRDRCMQWEANRSIARSAELYALREARRKDILSRVESLGYTESDTVLIWRKKDVSIAKPLTDKGWARLLPTLLQELNERKAWRLAREKKQRLAERESYIRGVYLDHLKTLMPTDVPFFPAPDQAVQFGPLSGLVEEDLEELTDEWHRNVEAAVLEAFPIIVECLRKHKERLVSLLPADGAVPADTETLSDTELDAKLALATTVYTMDTYSAPITYFGPEVFMRHGDESVAMSDGHIPRYAELPQNLDFSLFGHKAVRIILECLEKDPATLAADLDATDDRLLCLQCSQVPHDSTVYSWREAVAHARTHTMTVAGLDAFKVRALAADERAHIARKEMLLQKTRRGFGCAHCNAHLELEPARHGHYRPSIEPWMSREDVEAHVRERHDVADPQHNVDFFWNRSFAPRSAHLKYHCLLPESLGSESRIS